MRSARCRPPLGAPPTLPLPPPVAGRPLPAPWLLPLRPLQPQAGPPLPAGCRQLLAGRYQPRPALACRTRARRSRGPLRQGRDRGFVLPLAFGASLVLLLGSLSLQSLVLQRRLGLLREEQRGHQEDALASAAQQLVAALNRDHPCLLTLPLERWGSDGLPCASPEQQRSLAQGGGSGLWRLIDWQPQALRAQALIELEPGSPAQPARRGSFAVPLQEEPLQGQAPRLLALRGVAP